MNLREACDLAAEINADPDYLVVAIGRFQLINDLLRCDPSTFPWCMTIIARNSMQPTPIKIGDRDAWQTVRDMATQAQLLPPPQKPAAKRQDEPLMIQPTLF